MLTIGAKSGTHCKSCRSTRLYAGIVRKVHPEMEFVQKFTPPDFQAKNLHRQFHLISTVLVGKNTKNTIGDGGSTAL